MSYKSEKAGGIQTVQHANDLNSYIQELRQGITMLEMQILHQNRRAKQTMFNVCAYANIGNVSRAVVEQTMKNFGVKIPKESASILVLDKFQKIKYFEEKLKYKKSHAQSNIQQKEVNELAAPKKKRKMEQVHSNGREFLNNKQMKQNECSYQQ